MSHERAKDPSDLSDEEVDAAIENRRPMVRARAKPPRSPRTRPSQIFDAERTALCIESGALAATASRCEAILFERSVELYTRGGVVVRPIVEVTDAAHGEKTTTARLSAVDSVYMRDTLSRHIAFTRFDERKKAETPCDPPGALADTILARTGEHRFRPVKGVITTPTLRPDGSILLKEGYDEDTGLLLVSPPAMPIIASEPTREDAVASLERIESLFGEFPFVDEASRSVALSAVLTTVCRGAFPVTPGHAVTASTAGTGKSFIFDVVAYIATGRPCPVLAAGRTEEETEKRLASALLTGQPLISLDNVNGGLGGDALCQLIERPSPQVRVLGKSEVIKVDAHCTVFATGNNLMLQGDVTRRFVLATLDAQLERPELRQFKGNPKATVLENRGQFVADALTVCRAYVVAGRPQTLPRLASFEQWSDTVRSALAWLGKADPCATMETARAEDPFLARLKAVLVTWAECIGTGAQHAVTAAEVLDRDAGPFRDAVFEVSSNYGTPDARTLGKWLGRNKNRIVSGFQLHASADDHGHAKKWWVDRQGTKPAEAGQ